jgi:hypothetical protein
MPNPDCHIPAMYNANADSNGYSHADWNSDTYTYSHGDAM